jgi:two-component system chemotaxis response regulator CheY
MFESITTPSPHEQLPMGLPQRRRRILVVDDARSIRELLRIHLSNAGYEVLLAQDAMEAARMVLAEPPDLIITDIAMPYMDGVEFVSALRADRTLPFIPVVFLTSREDVDEHARLLRAAAYFTKPVDAEKLLKVVELHTA